MAGLRVWVSSRRQASLVEEGKCFQQDWGYGDVRRFPSQSLSYVSLELQAGPPGLGCLGMVPALMSGFLSSFSSGLSHPIPIVPAPQPSEQEAKEELKVDGQVLPRESAWPSQTRRFREEVKSLQGLLFPFQSFPFGFFFFFL